MLARFSVATGKITRRGSAVAGTRKARSKPDIAFVEQRWFALGPIKATQLDCELR